MMTKQGENMADGWKEINQLDENMTRVKNQKIRVENEIKTLQHRIKNLDTEFEELHSLWLFAGKERYGKTADREKLIQEGNKSESVQIRQAAYTLEIVSKDIKFDDDVKDDMIRICIFIEKGTKEHNNWNIKSMLIAFGKLGYDKYERDNRNEY